jgi:hypothetical protein
MKELPLKQQRGQPVQKKTKGERKFGRERSVEFGGVNPNALVFISSVSTVGTCLVLDILLSSQASTNRPEGFEVSHSV